VRVMTLLSARRRTACIAALAPLALLTACGTQAPPASPSATPGIIDVSVTDCGSSWHPTAAGIQDLALHNTDIRAGQIQVLGRGGLVYAEIEPFGPGTTVHLHVSLAAGTYRLACLMEDEAPVTGPRRTLSGPGHGVPGIRPITLSQLVPLTKHYTAWVLGQLPGLVRDTRRLDAAVAADDLPAARRAWLVAHLDYQRLGAAYDAFGDLGDRIDGLPQGLPGGTSDPDWHGFHRVERDLWVSASRPRLRGDTTALLRAVTQLRHSVGQVQIDPLALTIRAHEIAENALQFQLTGLDDFGSHTDLDSVRAELDGTQVVLGVLRHQIRSRVAGWRQIGATLHSVRASLTKISARWSGTAVTRLPRSVREELDADLGGLSERLAPIAATLEPRLVATSGNGKGAS
jgi:iron uptake system component EfeO